MPRGRWTCSPRAGGGGRRDHVYPSEGYYYFQFQNGPQRIFGNLRFDLADAAEGKLNFGYSSPRAFGVELVNHFSVLTAADGVSLAAVSPFEYRLGFEGRTIRVLIHDARAELAGPRPLAAGETYVGPVFDESGVRLHLLFDEVENAFFFVLNDAVPPAETYSAVPGSARVEVGDRTALRFLSRHGPQPADPGRRELREHSFQQLL